MFILDNTQKNMGVESNLDLKANLVENQNRKFKLITKFSKVTRKT